MELSENNQINIINIQKEFNLISRVPVILSGGISQDLVSDHHKSMGSELICSICLEIVLNPVMCSKCENLFCKSCIDILLTKTNRCPNKCIFQEKEKNRMLKNILSKIEFKCMYLLNGCKAFIPYTDFIKHVNSCDYGQFRCLANGCLVIDIKDKMLEHLKVCPYRKKLCHLCKEEIMNKEFDSHVIYCENKIISCQYCNQGIIHKNIDQHLEECEEMIIECKDCRSRMKRGLLINKQSVHDFEKEINKNISGTIHDENSCLKNQVVFWKSKYQDMLRENAIISEKLVETEKKNIKILNMSRKILQGQGDAQVLSNLQSNISDYRYEIINNANDPLLSLNLNLNNLSLEDDEEIFDSEFNLIPPNTTTYSLEVQKTLNDLSGIVYAICDLKNYEEGLACFGNFSSIVFFKYPQCTKTFTLEGHTSYIWSICHLYNYDKKILASGSQDNNVMIWNIDEKTCLRVLSGHTNWVTLVTPFMRENNLLISCAYDHTVLIWDLNTGEQIRKLNNVFGKCCGNAYYFNPNFILYGTTNNNICVYDYSTDNVKFLLHGHFNLVNCFANIGEFNKNYVATGSEDRSIILWELEGGVSVNTYLGHTECVTSIVHLIGFTSQQEQENSIFASSSDDKTIRLWSLVDFTKMSIRIIFFLMEILL
jgi:WD40 repeat protein